MEIAEARRPVLVPVGIALERRTYLGRVLS
jgi:hypothetical protein